MVQCKFNAVLPVECQLSDELASFQVCGNFIASQILLFHSGNTAILKHCLKFCRIPHLKSLWSTTITYPVGQR
ncbi:hypothetical protein EC140933_05173 [Escherichia coli O145:H28]|nr:hypothetical protein EC140933_05173 [Escherichia coli O145:H28]